MGIYFRIADFDKLLNDVGETRILNDMPSLTTENTEKINKLIMTKYNNNQSLSNEPSCECGETKYGFNLGVICTECKSEVKDFFDRDIKPIVWIRRPNGVQKLLKPIVYLMLRKVFSKRGFNYIEYLCNTRYSPKIDKPEYLYLFENNGIKRGYNFFVENFQFIIETLLNDSKFNKIKNTKLKKKKAATVINPNTNKEEIVIEVDPDTGLDTIKEVEVEEDDEDLEIDKEEIVIEEDEDGDENTARYLKNLLFNKYKDKIFSDYIPLPNKDLLIIENTSSNTFVDPTVMLAIDAVRVLVGIDNDIREQSVRQKENKTFNAISGLADFYEDTFKISFSKKSSMFRHHIFGTRSHFSLRAVITSNTDKHEYDGLHIAWSHGIELFKLHISNKLLKMCWKPNEILTFLQEHTHKYHELLDQIFQELLSECPEQGIPVSINRNPVMTKLSIQKMFITKIKTDPRDFTISIPITNVNRFNAF